MPTRGVHGARKVRVRRKRRIAAGGLALGVSSLLALGGLASPASADGPTAIAQCTGNPASPTLTAFVSGFPPDERFYWFGVVHVPDGDTFTFQGFSFVTDSTGVGAIGFSMSFPPLPLEARFAAFRDNNGNARWDAGDDTIFSGSGTVTDCPQDALLAPK